MVSPSLIDIRNLRFKREDRLIFDKLSFSIPKGEVTAVLGPSGTGKTTLLHLIAGELDPLEGEILIEGINLKTLNRQARFELRHRMGVLLQSGALFSGCTVYENVALPLRMHTTLPETMIRTLCIMKLEAVGLRGTEGLCISQLSGGMARRVALARALALDPELLLIDEPFTGQDPINLGVLAKLLKELNEVLGITILIVSHDLHETLAIADKAYLLSEGSLAAEGSAADLMSNQLPYVKQFVNGLIEGPVPFRYPAKNDYTEALLGSAEPDYALTSAVHL